LTVDVQGSQTKAWLLNYLGQVGRSTFAPRGARLAVESLPATAVAHVVIVDTVSSGQVDIGSERRGHSAAEPAWAQDGERLAAVVWTGDATATGPRELVVFGPDGQAQSRVAAGDVGQAAWNPTPTAR
jgi:hypothetical protein